MHAFVCRCRYLIIEVELFIAELQNKNDNIESTYFFNLAILTTDPMFRLFHENYSIANITIPIS